MKISTPLTELTEREFSRLIYDAADMLGWKRYHTYRSNKSAAGFPDEFLVRDRIVLVEVKTEAGKLTDVQRQWLTLLAKAGEVYLVRPRNLDDLVQVLRWRSGRPVSPEFVQARTRLLLELDSVIGGVKAA